MPIEIRELIIKAQLGGDEDAGASGTAGADHNQQGGNDSVIQDCVEKVLAILKERAER